MGNKKVIMLGDVSNVKWHGMKETEKLVRAMEAEGWQIECSEDYPAITADKLREYAVCINYIDNWEDRGNEAAGTALLTYMWEGGRMLSIHNGIILKKSPELLAMHGAAFTGHSEYDMLHYLIPENPHVILEGLEDFSLTEEPYEYRMICPDKMDIFLQYEYRGECFPAAWTIGYGKGKMVYIAIGHDGRSFGNLSFRKLCGNSLKWLA